MRVRSQFCLLTFLAASAAFARGATPSELIVHLKYKPQEGVHSSTANVPPSKLEKSVEIRVDDRRGGKDPLVIGTGTGGDDKTFPIKAASNIKPFIEETLESVAKNWGLKTEEKNADRILAVTVTRFFIDESNKALGSVYTSEVKLAFALKNSSGKVLTEGAGTGSAHRYGRAHSVENINEVLSDALKEAFANILDDSALKDAWGSGKAKKSD